MPGRSARGAPHGIPEGCRWVRPSIDRDAPPHRLPRGPPMTETVAYRIHGARPAQPRRHRGIVARPRTTAALLTRAAAWWGGFRCCGVARRCRRRWPGSRGRSYATTVTLDVDDGELIDWSSSCTCPMARGLHARRRGARVGQVGGREHALPALAAWLAEHVGPRWRIGSGAGSSAAHLGDAAGRHCRHRFVDVASQPRVATAVRGRDSEGLLGWRSGQSFPVRTAGSRPGSTGARSRPITPTAANALDPEPAGGARRHRPDLRSAPATLLPQRERPDPPR